MNDFLAANPPAAPQELPAPPHPQDPDRIVGPVELNLLERVEFGLALSDSDTHSRQNSSSNNTCKFEGQRQVIFVSGWADIHQIFAQMRAAFLVKAIVAITAILCLRLFDQKLWPVAACLLLHSLAAGLFAAHRLYLCWHSDPVVKMPLFVDLNEALGQQVFFLGFFLYLSGEMQPRPLPLFAIPGLLYSTLVFLYFSEESLSLSVRKFMVVEWLQMALISLKVSGAVSSSWNYTLFLYMAGAIYLTVLGMFLAMILSCSVVGVLQGRVLGWKSRALAWMTWNYLSSGLTYILLIKAVLHFYNDDGLSRNGPVTDFQAFKNEDALPVLLRALTAVAVVSFASFLPAVFMRRDLTRFLAKVVYKHEVRKEVSLRTISKSFTFKLIQASATYFLKTSPVTGDEKADPLAPSDSHPVPTSSAQPTKSAIEREPCFMCCDALPDVMLDPCGHGGVCQSCVVAYLRHQGERCPICKQRMDRVYVLGFDEEDGRYITKGEIKLGN